MWKTWTGSWHAIWPKCHYWRELSQQDRIQIILIATDLNWEFLDKVILFWVCFMIVSHIQNLELKRVWVLIRWFWLNFSRNFSKLRNRFSEGNGWKGSRYWLCRFDRRSSQSSSQVHYQQGIYTDESIQRKAVT